MSSSARDYALGAALVGLLLLNVGAVAGGVTWWAARPLPEVEAPEREPYVQLDRGALEAFGERLESVLRERPGQAPNLFDLGEIGWQATEGQFDDVEERGAFLRTLLDGIIRRGFLARLTAPGATVLFRGVVDDDDGRWVRLRLLDGGGVDFFDLAVGARHDQERVFELRSTNGIWLTSELRGWTAALRDAADPEALEGALSGLFLALAQEDGPAAWEAFEALPEALRRQPGMLGFRLRAGKLAGRLEEAVAEAEAALPDDPQGRAALLQPWHLELERFDDAREDVAVLASAFPDPAWDVVGARVELAAGEAPQALALANRARADDPAFRLAPLTQLEAALVLGDEAAAREALDALVTDFGVDALRLSEVEGFEGVADLVGGSGTLPPGATGG